MLEIAQYGELWHACLHYNTGLFDKTTAQRMLGHFMVGLSAYYAAQTLSCKVLYHSGYLVDGAEVLSGFMTLRTFALAFVGSHHSDLSFNLCAAGALQ